MAERPGDEEVEITGSERLLAFLLAVFIAVGAIWAYFEAEDQVRADPAGWRAASLEHLDASDRAAIEALDSARTAEFRAERRASQARRRMVLAREAYRTELDAGRPAAVLQRAYREANERLEAADASAAAAHAKAEAIRPAAVAARDRLDAEIRERQEETRENRTGENRRLFLIRMAMLIFLLSSGLWLLTRGTARLGRWRLVPASVLTATATLAVVMAIDYGADYVDFSDVGPGLISAAGIALTLVTMFAVQRSVARRLPYRRVRRGLCPFCGFPGSAATGLGSAGSSHCEGCGRSRLAPCHSCDRPRRVGTRYCGHCGNP